MIISSERPLSNLSHGMTTSHYIYYSEMWSVFQRGTSWYQILCHLLYTNRISHANIIWLRHKVCYNIHNYIMTISIPQQAVETELIDMMNSDQIPQLIPSDISLMNSWLQSTILPFILTHCPHLMVTIVTCSVVYRLW